MTREASPPPGHDSGYQTLTELVPPMEDEEEEVEGVFGESMSRHQCRKYATAAAAAATTASDAAVLAHHPAVLSPPPAPMGQGPGDGDEEIGEQALDLNNNETGPRLPPRPPPPPPPTLPNGISLSFLVEPGSSAGFDASARAQRIIGWCRAAGGIAVDFASAVRSDGIADPSEVARLFYVTLNLAERGMVTIRGEDGLMDRFTLRLAEDSY